jgi:hypothetical protein
MKSREIKKLTKPLKLSKSAQKEPKKVSKIWLAVLSILGAGEVLDMRAVLK